MPHKPGHKNGRNDRKRGRNDLRKRLKRAALRRSIRSGKSPTKAGQRFFGDVDAGRSKQDSIRHLSGAQVTNAELKRYLRGQK